MKALKVLVAGDLIASYPLAICVQAPMVLGVCGDDAKPAAGKRQPALGSQLALNSIENKLARIRTKEGDPSKAWPHPAEPRNNPADLSKKHDDTSGHSKGEDKTRQTK